MNNAINATTEGKNAYSSVEFQVGYVCLLLLSIIGALGNSLVIIATRMVKRLRTSYNIQVASLATADLLVSLLVMPLSTLQLVLGKWTIGNVMCLVYIYLDVMLCTSSILHMLSISLDRYVGIAHPLKSSNFKGKRAVTIKIVKVWLMSALIASPIIAHYISNESAIYVGDQCGVNSKPFMVYGSTFSFFIPLTIMSAVYTLTTRKLRKCPSISRCSGDKLRVKHIVSLESCSSVSNSLQQLNQSQYLTIRQDSETNSVRVCNTVQQPYTHQSCRNSEETRPDCATQKITFLSISKRLNLKLRPEWMQSSNYTSATPPSINGNIEPNSRRNSPHILMNEKKAIQVLGVVFISFVVCWLPFFTSNLIFAFFDNYDSNGVVSIIALWLGYTASIVNPIIYTTVNKYYQQAFREIITCRIWNRQTPTLRDTLKHMHKQCIALSSITLSCNPTHELGEATCTLSSSFVNNLRETFV